MTITIVRPTEAICPPWCAGHEGGYQGWETLTETGRKIRDHSDDGTQIGGLVVMISQIEHEDSGMREPRVIVLADDMKDQHELTDVQAHELGLAIVRAGDLVRRYRMAAER